MGAGKMRIGFVTLGMGASPLDEVLKTAAAAGCEVMELNGRATVHQNLWAQPVNYAGLKARIAASGIVPTSLGGYSNFAQTTDEALAAQVEQFVGYCQVAREMGIPIVRAFAGDVLEGHTLDQLESGMPPIAEQGLTPEKQRVHHGDIVPPAQQNARQERANVARPAGDEDMSGHPGINVSIHAR